MKRTSVYSTTTMTTTCTTKHVMMGFPLKAFICLSLLLNLGVQADSSCQADQITIRDPMAGSVQCQDCLKCPSGEGLSVHCGDVITPTTPVQCKPCVLGEKFSAAYEAGACKDCENCGEYRETTKACTLTSKAECGNCKPGAYAEGMLGQCKPCSPCCNDGKDVIEPECQAQGMPPSMQCSFLRSKKCSALVAKEHASNSTTPPTLQPKQSTLPWATSPSVTSSKVNSPSSEPVAHLADDASPPLSIITGSVVGGFFVVIFPLVVTIRYFMGKRKKNHQKRIGLDNVENGTGHTPQREQGNDQTNDEGSENEVDEGAPLADIDLFEDTPLSLPIQVEADDEEQEKKGIQESARSHSESDSKPSGAVLKGSSESSREHHSNTNVISRKTTVTVLQVTSDEQITRV